MRTITIINQSSVVNAADFAAAVAACQRQLDEHVAPAWSGITAQLATDTAAPGVPQNPMGETIYILDDSDQQGALGYHELTNVDSPVGYVFAKTSQDAGDPWQTTLSHELIEQLLDPYIDSCVVVDKFPVQAGTRHAGPACVEYELCDPVENDSYPINGVPMSNFVLPAWFQSQDTPGAHGPYDYMQKLTAPLTMTAGGYIAFMRLHNPQWQQVTARTTEKPDKYARHGIAKKVFAGVVKAIIAKVLKKKAA